MLVDNKEIRAVSLGELDCLIFGRYGLDAEAHFLNDLLDRVADVFCIFHDQNDGCRCKFVEPEHFFNSDTLAVVKRSCPTLRLSGSPTQLPLKATHGESAPSACYASARLNIFSSLNESNRCLRASERQPAAPPNMKNVPENRYKNRNSIENENSSIDDKRRL